MKIYRWLLFGSLLLLGSVGHAEGNCPDGYYPIGATSGQGGPQGCAPIPGYGNNQTQAQSRPLPQRWVDRWMTIATDAVKGSLGTAVNMSSSNEAEEVAMADCRAKGGTQCKIDVTYVNGCAAMVAGDTGFNVHGAPTLNEAIQQAMNTCTASTTHCRVYYSACSMPVRIQ